MGFILEYTAVVGDLILYEAMERQQSYLQLLLTSVAHLMFELESYPADLVI